MLLNSIFFLCLPLADRKIDLSDTSDGRGMLNLGFRIIFIQIMQVINFSLRLK